MHIGDFTAVSLDLGKVYEVTRKSARSVLWSLSLPWDQQASKSTESMPGIKEELEVAQGIRLPLSRNSELLISHTLQNCSLIYNEERGRQRSTREGRCCSCKWSSERESTPLGARPAWQTGCEASRAAAEHKPCRRTHTMAKAETCDDGETLLTGPMFTSRHTEHPPHRHARAQRKGWTPCFVFILLTKILLLVSCLSIAYNRTHKTTNHTDCVISITWSFCPIHLWQKLFSALQWM